MAVHSNEGHCVVHQPQLNGNLGRRYFCLFSSNLTKHSQHPGSAREMRRRTKLQIKLCPKVDNCELQLRFYIHLVWAKLLILEKNIVIKLILSQLLQVAQKALGSS